MGVDPDKLIDEFCQGELDSVFYNEKWLREWESGTKNFGRYRFYLRSIRGGSQDSDTQYWRCTKADDEIEPVGFERPTRIELQKETVDKAELPQPVEVEYSIGKINTNPVIISVSPEYFW